VIPTYTPDLFSDEVLADPYEHYRALRELGPVVWLEAQQMYVLPRYHDVRAAERDPETFCSGQGVGLNDLINEAGRGTTLNSDGERHDTQRRLLFGPLTPKALLAIREDVQATADVLVDDLTSRGRFDGVVDLARALPLTVVPDLLGWPEHGRDELLPWAAATFDAMGPANRRAEAAVPPVMELLAFSQQLAEQRDLAPDSVGARILAAADRGEIAPEQIPPLLIDYLAPSMDTTISALGHALALFARHPDQWQAVREDPSLVPRAFNEVLRLESPIRCFSRVTTSSVEVDGSVIPSGARVVLHYASANRDERMFDDPDRFDVRRQNAGSHLAFGVGAHTCAGQGLARVEAHALLTALAQRVSTITVEGATQGFNNLINAYATLPTTIVAATAPAHA
jgi:cytochrome P450